MNDRIDMALRREVVTAGAGDRPPQVVLLSLLLTTAVRGRPCLEEMGLRVWLMVERLMPGLLWRLSAAERREALAIMGRLGRELVLEVEGCGEVEMRAVLTMVVGRETTLRRLGRRATLLAYVFERGDVVREALPSMEAIGLLWGLTATNKRSAVSAAIRNDIRRMEERGELLSRVVAQNEFWFSKRRATREKCARAQRGNGNRRGSLRGRAAKARALAEEAEEEETRLAQELQVRFEGVPVRAEFRAMSPRQLKAHLDALHEAAERRRLLAVG